MRYENYRIILWSFGFAALASVAYFLVAWSQDKTLNKHDSLQLMTLSDHFNHTYSLIRKDDMPVPATFRRTSIESFNAQPHFQNENMYGTSEFTRVLWPGRPDSQMNRSTDNPRLLEIMEFYSANPEAEPIYEQFFKDGRLFGRTALPSIAGDQSCVDCHNESLKRQEYKLGDVMGISVVERDMTDLLITDIRYAGGVFVLTFFITWAFAVRERRRNENIIALKSRVEVERIKAETEEKEKFLLSHDSLTGLPNRKLFHDYLNPATSGKDKQQLYTAIIDLDDFKHVNDTLGHAAGDALLAEVARRLIGCMDGMQGLAARLGGDEFAVVWHAHEPESEPYVFAPLILTKMSEPLNFESSSITPKCSIGLAAWADTKNGEAREMLKLADIALYVAKGRGKNTYQVYDQTLDARIRRKNEIADNLLQGIRDDNLTLVVQPQVDLEGGRFLGFEALSRWTLKGEEIPPSKFIKVAESIGVIRELDVQVLRKAAHFSADLARKMGRSIPISINLSAQSFQNEHLLKEIEQILEDAELPAHCLTIEVSEATVIENWGQVQEMLEKLRNTGIRIALDNFANAYAYLMQMKFDQIKIDQAFVHGLEYEINHHKFLQHISAISTNLDVELIVKGIETQRQFELIQKTVVGGGQGYFFTKPLKLNEAETYLA